MREAFGSPGDPAGPGVLSDLTQTQLTRRVASLEDSLAQLRAETETDHLTGLGNRRMLERRASDRWQVMADLDGFKRAQDGHPRGHDYGDEVLREFASFLRRTCRREDSVVVRLGGDEFAVGVTSQEAALAIRDRLRGWRSLDGMVSCSVGIGQDLAHADASMYIDKERRRR